MTLVLNALVAFIALQHFGFMILEMFLWTKPSGLRIFNQSLQKAQDSAVLASNQGLYNGFLAAGLVWSLMTTNPDTGHSAKDFFLSCVFLAGLFGARTVNKRIFFVQALPAFVALILLYTIH